MDTYAHFVVVRIKYKRERETKTQMKRMVFIYLEFG